MKYKTLFFLICIVVSYSQKVHSQIYYVQHTYDASGNRIKRLVTSNGFFSIDDELEIMSETENKENTDEQKAKMQPKISYNPDTEKIRILILNFTSSNIGEICTYNSSGILLSTQNITDEVSILDFSNQPSGVYIIRVNIEGTITTKKFIK